MWEHELEQIIELAEAAHESAMSELAAFGSWDAIPSCIEAFGLHEAIETQIAGAFGMRDGVSAWS